MRQDAKVDANHAQIVKEIREAGIAVIDVHRLPNLFDILVPFRGVLYPFEIKNPEYVPKKGKPEDILTKGEIECRDLLYSAGVPYFVVVSSDEILKIIGAI